LIVLTHSSSHHKNGNINVLQSSPALKYKEPEMLVAVPFLVGALVV